MLSAPNAHISLRASCESCRKCKVRCKRDGVNCSRCSRLGQKCVFAPLNRKARPKAAASSQQAALTEMRNRLERVESLLSPSMCNAPDQHQVTPLLPVAGPVAGGEESSFCLIDRMGFSTFIGPASDFSLLSPRGLQSISVLIGSTELSDFVLNRARTYMLSWSEEMISAWQHTPDDQVPLPPRESAIVMVNHFFTTINLMLPVYDQGKFMELFEQQYSGNPPKGASWYASLNAVLGLGRLMFEDVTRLNSPTMDSCMEAERTPHVLSCLRNCYSVFTQLAYSSREVMAVQALIVMAMILEFLLDIEASYMAIGMAARLAFALGLHRAPADSHPTPSEIEQRHNVFWVLYVLDRRISLRLGRPPTMGEDDIDVSESGTCQLLRRPHVNNGLSFFAHFVKLTRIKSKIYSKFYSVRFQKSDGRAEKLATLNDLDEMLAIQRESLPELPPLEPLPSPAIVHSTVLLHAEYYNCQLLLHRTGLYREAFSGCETPSTESHGVSSRTKCLKAARHTAQLLNSLLENGTLSRNNLARQLSYYTLSAFFDIFINLLLHPKDPRALSDFHLLQTITDLMSGALTASSSPLALLLSEILQKVTEIAKDVLLRPQSDNANQSTLTPVVPASNTNRYLVDAIGGVQPCTISSAQQPTGLGYASYFPNSFTSNVRPCVDPVPAEWLVFGTADDTLRGPGQCLQ